MQIRGDRLDGTFVDTEDFDLAGLIALLEGLPDPSMSPPQPTDPPLTGIGAAVTLVGLTGATRKHFSRLA